MTNLHLDDTDDLVNAALSYAARGWHVFPIRPRDKRPITLHGNKDATTDVDTIAYWWSQHPTANVGVSAGPSNLFIIDVDSYKDPDLDDVEAFLDGTHHWIDGRPWPETYTTRTGSGGMQFWFHQHPERRLGNGGGPLHKNIDHRGDGGYVVAPPSRTLNQYQVLRDAPVADVPTWVVDLLQRPKVQARAEHNYQPIDSANPYVTNYGSVALAKNCAEMAACVDGRNIKLNNCAYNLGRLVAGGQIDQSTAERDLWLAAQASSNNGAEPLTDQEIGATIRSGMDSGMARPWLMDDRDGRTFKPAAPPAPPVKIARVNRQKISDVIAERPKFLWGNRLIRGGITIIAGTGGIGKSYATLDVAGALANGKGLPGQETTDRGSSVIISYEDPTEVIKARFEDMGVNPDGPFGSAHAIYGPEMFESVDGEDVKFAPEHIDLLLDDLRTIPGLRLVVIDPLMSFMGDGVDPNSDPAVRGVLHRLLAMAKELDVAVLVVAHTKKGTMDWTVALDSIAGSSGIKNFARSCLICVRDPDDQQKTYVDHAKSNWTAPAPCLMYRMFSQDESDKTFRWFTGPIPQSKFKAVLTRSVQTPKVACARWLEKVLNVSDGVHETKIRQDAEEQGYDQWVLEEAARLVQVRLLGDRWALPAKRQWKGGDQ